MARFAANLSLLFAELPFLDRFEAAADAGFEGVEFLFPYAWSATDIKQRLDDNGLQPVLFNIAPGDWDAGERGLAAIENGEARFASSLAQALDYAAALGVKRLHAMAGLEQHGARRETYLANLAYAAVQAAPFAIDILIEPINTFDMPGYHLTRTADAAEAIANVGAANLRLQLDLYHRHRMEGDALAATAEFAPLVAHYQIAGPPDRGEPIPSELDLPALMDAIDATGYEGWIGCEYRPRNGTAAGLGWRDQLRAAGCSSELR